MKANIIGTIIAILMSTVAARTQAGDLNPPVGPVAPTHKTLTEVEPRIAVNATNTPGDATSVFKITQPGSYYLAANVAGQPAKHGITASGGGNGDLTIDLNGFSLVGVPGSLNGINGGGTVNVCNGTVKSWGGIGVTVSRGILKDLHLESNGSHGLIAVWGVVISHCVAEANGGNGIHVADVSRIEACVSKGNTGQGIHLDGAGTVADCVVYNNPGGGIDAGLSAQVTGCTAFTNSSFGIRVTNGSRVADNDIMSAGIGIRVAGDRSRVEGNNISAVTGILIEGSRNHVEGNTITIGTTGIDVNPATGNLIIRNSASGNTTNYDIAAGNTMGPIVNSGNIATDSNPHANYEF